MLSRANILHGLRRCLALVAVACVCLCSYAQTEIDSIAAAKTDSIAAAKADAEYNRIAAKAARFFDNSEWLNANAMYMLMLDERPLDVKTYSHAIVANIMSGDTVSMGNLLELSMRNNVPFDSLLYSVQHVSMQVGSSDLYEKVLLTSRDRFSWLSRGINAYLLKYYDFRNNGPEIIRYAKIMLAGMPDDVTFQRQLARGYMLDNQPDNALSVWLNVLQHNPEHYDTLLDVGMYYEETARHNKAVDYLQRAYDIRPTPYVQELLQH